MTQSKKVGRPSKKESSELTTVRMNINLPKSFHKKIKQTALDEDATVTEIVIKALKEYMDKK